jgi:hypothetical protein
VALASALIFAALAMQGHVRTSDGVVVDHGRGGARA